MPNLLDVSIPKKAIAQILKTANSFKFASTKLKESTAQILKGEKILLAFFENSTRTISSFEIAALNLGAHPLRLDVERSSMSKGEALLETLITLDAMEPACIVLRHRKDGIFKSLSVHLNAKLINAGEGKTHHPTQALLDLLTIINHHYRLDSKTHASFDYQTALDEIKSLKIALIGDVSNSRVASSNIELLSSLGVRLRILCPACFAPKGREYSPVLESNPLDYAMALRVQFERHDEELVSAEKYAQSFCIQKEWLYNTGAQLMHPGPINPDVDVARELLKDERSLITEQVRNGVFIRMACYLYALNKLEDLNGGQNAR